MSWNPETILSEPTYLYSVCICNKKLDLFGFIGPTVLKCLFNVTVVRQKQIKYGLILTKLKKIFIFFILNTLNSGFEDLKGFKLFILVVYYLNIHLNPESIRTSIFLSFLYVSTTVD